MHALLAADRGGGRDPDVDARPVDRDLDLAVLRPAPLDDASIRWRITLCWWSVFSTRRTILT